MEVGIYRSENRGKCVGNVLVSSPKPNMSELVPLPGDKHSDHRVLNCLLEKEKAFLVMSKRTGL